tara:strand:- start:170 stop:664 length:495 start_codon:yes stop_codon:yes gene_type:complete
MTLPDTADGTILTTTNPKAGNIIQVVQAVKTDTASFQSTSFADITGLSASITPSSNSNKILVEATIYISTSNAVAIINFVRGSTNIGQPSSSVTHTGTFFEYNEHQGMVTSAMTFLDSPSTTNATTYKLQIRASNTNFPLYINRYTGANDYYGISTLTLKEIAA